MLCGISQANAAEHEKSFGVQGGWNSRNESAVAGLTFSYRFTNHFRLGADAEVGFRNKDRDAFLIDVDAQFPFATSSRIELYPLAGVNFSAWSRHLEPTDENDDVTTRTSNFGLNLGGGMGFRATSTLKLSLDARYSLVKSNSGVRVTVGIAYMF